MFKNIGGKIKAWARAICICGIVLCVLYGFVLVANKAVFSGLSFMLYGSLISWLSCFVLYGFGQLIENSEISIDMTKKIGIIVETMANNQSDSAPFPAETKNGSAENLVKLKKLYEMGVITSDEYEKTKAALLSKLASE